MRIALLFPPRCSPTYAPLGISSLAGVIRMHVPTVQLLLHDLNVSTWEWVAGGTSLRTILQDPVAFYEPTTYEAATEAMPKMIRYLDKLGMQARHYVETGEASGELHRLLDRLLQEVLAQAPERIGISVMYPEQLYFALALGSACHAQGGPPVILGGAMLSALDAPALLAACPFLAALVPGEGEPAAIAWASGAPVEQLPGAIYLQNGGVKKSPLPHEPIALDLCPAPDFAGLEMTRYFNPEPVLPITASRGCGWRRCRFCAHNASFGHYRGRTASLAVDDLEHLQARHGATAFYFADQFVDATTLEALSDELLRRDLHYSFHIMGRMTADYTRELLAKASAAGCGWISWGTESGSQRLLDVVRKGARVEEMERILFDAAEVGISNLAMMLYGLPGSTSQDLEQTFGFLTRTYGALDAMTASSFVLFANTPFGRRPAHYGLEILGREVLLERQGQKVHSMRLHFRRSGETQEGDSALGQAEVELWGRYRPWLGPTTLLDRLPCEHYLLYTKHRNRLGNRRPSSPLPLAG